MVASSTTNDSKQAARNRKEHTQMHPRIVGLVLVLVLFAVDLVQNLVPVLVATRHDALDSSRLYSYSSALTLAAMVGGRARSQTGIRVRDRCSS